MNFKWVLGIDVSKDKLNLCLMNQQIDVVDEWEIANTLESIETFLVDLLAENKFSKSELIVVLENTGLYDQHLTKMCLMMDLAVSLEHASNITEHIIGKNYVEEKNDPLDARRIAEYGIRFQDKLRLFEPCSDTILMIKRLNAQRNRLMKSLNILLVPIKEIKEFDTKPIYNQLNTNQSNVVKELKQAIKEVEKQIEKCITDDQQLSRYYELMQSVEGIGPVTARELLVRTEGFTKFKTNQAKAFSRYAAVVPVSKQSGKKKGRARTPKRKNQSLKSLLTMGALSLIASKSDLGEYYRRKIGEGKEHLLVINNMRNKIILRVFAVVRNNTTYEKKYKLT